MAEATLTIKNISGTDLAVGPQNMPQVEVPAGAQQEFPADVARSLLEQSDVWAPVGDAKQAATRAKDQEG